MDLVAELRKVAVDGLDMTSYIAAAITAKSCNASFLDPEVAVGGLPSGALMLLVSAGGDIRKFTVTIEEVP